MSLIYECPNCGRRAAAVEIQQARYDYPCLGSTMWYDKILPCDKHLSDYKPVPNTSQESGQCPANAH